MSALIVPRGYQIDAVNSTFDWFARNQVGNPLVGMPTGTGKSVVIVGTQFVMLNYVDPHHRFLALTHVEELIKQNSAKLREVWPNAPMGIHSAGLGVRDCVQPLLFGGVQSVASTLKTKRFNPFGHINTVQIDECHLVSPEKATMYQFVIDTLKITNPRLRIIGYTATAFRMKQGLLNEGDGAMFSDFAYNKTTRDDFNWFIREGYLCPLIPRSTETEIDISGVHLSGGEFNQKELEAATNVERITVSAVREMCAYGRDRNKWLVFASGIEHAENVVRILEAHGIDADCVHSKKAAGHNDRAIDAFKHGRLRCLVNANKLTTGFDCPQVDLIGMLRATMSPILHVQMLGRGTRPFPGKPNCLVLDFARNVPRLGPINDPVLPRKPGQKAGAGAPIKECANCGTFNHTSARTCIGCSAEFEFQTHLTRSAGTHELIAGLTPIKQETHNVINVVYREQSTKSGPMLKAVYYIGVREASKLLGFEHAGYPGHEARKWWRARTDLPEPQTISEALRIATQGLLRRPKRITIQIHEGSKYPQIVSEEF